MTTDRRTLYSQSMPIRPHRAMLLLLVSLAASEHAAAAAPGTTPFTAGWDFSLPGSVGPAPNAGLLWMNNPAKRPEFRHEGRTLTWSKMHPGPGRYDFSEALKI